MCQRSRDVTTALWELLSEEKNKGPWYCIGEGRAFCHMSVADEKRNVVSILACLFSCLPSFVCLSCSGVLEIDRLAEGGADRGDCADRKSRRWGLRSASASVLRVIPHSTPACPPTERAMLGPLLVSPVLLSTVTRFGTCAGDCANNISGIVSRESLRDRASPPFVSSEHRDRSPPASRRWTWCPFQPNSST